MVISYSSDPIHLKYYNIQRVVYTTSCIFGIILELESSINSKLKCIFGSLNQFAKLYNAKRNDKILLKGP
uniref:Uncharacterized protein n=1 Tax=Pararge aegeria TaxID=116150 RepID=S4PV03_9NEOP